MQKLLEQIAATAELMGQQISPTAAAVMAKDLSAYSLPVVIEALKLLRHESKFRLSLAAVIEKIELLQPDGRLSADEAWATIPRDERTSAVMTAEMLEAWGIAKPLLDEGDQVAARMAFKEAYTRLVDTAKRAGTPPKWFPSLGSDKEGRDVALGEAVRLGRLGAQHAISLLPPDKVAPMLQLAGETTLALEHKMPTSDQALANFAKMKAMLANSKLSKPATKQS